ncbi:MAG: hypothetical protein IKU38_04250 [Clostridia bacterium]|nr:hypothetical protein [Clostridia bacterium]
MLNNWSLRRVLLAGESSEMLRTMDAQLCAAGARPFHTSAPFCEEALSRMLQQRRCACVIVPDLLALDTHDPQARFDALDMLLGEIREAGVPLAILLYRINASHDSEAAQLFSHAAGWAHGMFGDPVNIQCIRYAAADIRRVCLDALMLGARFLAGETACTGIFTFT